MTNTTAPSNAITWFEIGCRNLAQSQAFFEAVTARPMRREAMGPSEGAVFTYAGEGVGGALMCGPTAPAPGASGTLVYLDCSPSLDAALARAVAAGGKVAVPRQALPPGMGFFAHVQDIDGNRIGLHAMD
ncbi:VOC family protein [Rhodoferax saidenbachensis]|uniref:Glyoxalase n=1 Tax=Rhodoferax saidenbachensis TaxID=1484693 RepID=A0A1P8KFA1_9BURK|nr:VOC family protein [Rhodoferax saidenbachensis]APW44646.1 glyoxalase [Rhodoferax saidenbachensis]